MVAESIKQLLLETLVPILLLFSAERFSLRMLSGTHERREWVRGTFWLHPNFITRCRYPMGFISIFIYHFSPLAGVFWFAFWMITDLTDGSIARYFDLHTEEGETLDPFSDKLLYFPPLFYFSWLGLIDIALFFFFLAFDCFGQISRYFIKKKSANLFGKSKTFMAVITLVVIAAKEIYFPYLEWRAHWTSWGILPNWLLLITVSLAFFSSFFKVVPNYWYANILSLLNLCCGLTGIVLLLLGKPTVVSFGLIFLGQLLDLFDGRAAERWGSTPKGELLDDLADGTSFGGTLAVLIFFSMGETRWAFAVALIHFSATVFRLVRFLKEKRAVGIQGGVELFSGLPAPAAALLTGSAILLFQDYIALQTGVVLFSSLLMVSRISYIHFGRVILPSIPIYPKIFLLMGLVVGTLVAMIMQGLPILYGVLLTCSLGYVVIGRRRREIAL
ncbi:MAG: CDP-alcohol phosphatidyltransferase family protein [Nitrospinota bacterium]